jgi:putative endonuclease
MTHREFGRFGEEAAARWYGQAGYRVLDRNWRCAEAELDLIVAEADTVAFVEVKARSHRGFGTGAEAVDHRKQKRLRTGALRWLATADEYFNQLRFDVVEVDRRGHLQVHLDCF